MDKRKLTDKTSRHIRVFSSHDEFLVRNKRGGPKIWDGALSPDHERKRIISDVVGLVYINFFLNMNFLAQTIPEMNMEY